MNSPVIAQPTAVCTMLAVSSTISVVNVYVAKVRFTMQRRQDTGPVVRILPPHTCESRAAHEDERVSAYLPTLCTVQYIQKQQESHVANGSWNPQRNKRQAVRLLCQPHETEDRRWGCGGVLLCCRSLIKDHDPGKWSKLTSGRTAHTVGGALFPRVPFRVKGSTVGPLCDGAHTGCSYILSKTSINSSRWRIICCAHLA